MIEGGAGYRPHLAGAAPREERDAMDIGWKVVSAGGGVLSGIVANKIVDVVWKGISGREIPDSEDPNAPLVDAVIFAVVSAGVAAAVSQLTQRQAAKWYGKGEVIDSQARARA